MDAARSGNSKNCEALLDFVISCFDSPEGFTVMDSILFEVFSPLLNCSHVSQTCHESFQRLAGIITERCTAREVIVLLLAALDDRPRDEEHDWQRSDAMLMGALVDALGGLQRSQCQMLEDCLVLVLKLARRAHSDAVPAPSEAPISIPADAFALSTLASHQRRAIFGDTAPAAEPAAAALRVLEAAAAALRELSSEGNQDNVGSENEAETSALWEAEEVALGEHLLTHAALSEALAMKGLQIAAAAACRAGTASAGFGGGVRQLLQALTTTMAGNPLQPVRNAAHYSADAVLSALTVTARLAAAETLFEEGHPGVSALVINRVAHDAQALWPKPDEDAPSLEMQQGWRELEPALLPLIRGWLEPHGSHGWHEPSGLMRNAEPISAALNLYMLLLLRASNSGCMPGIMEKGALKGVMEDCLKPLRVAGLQTVGSLKGAEDAGSSGNTDAMLAIERVLLVLTWIMGTVEKKLAR
ncbi:hypothetical protein COCSUDRAFT_66551 [Coccomyxa subellipsoidea C-169]|uniref:Uncharacterized protein n=1 Tax=Coccomyxa subellipsoidea (strain C-169) TaxID=574566 RepID=I0YV77_COCSC|nr:hypothetical protein COCSUDRAFT_66551 [Coccomyxa subellipsoidea C-169]EIE22296.1 hypothetical protein COCSUDRAFT_66551 [Coccomyxa subellipsoidea C-169]|eukprot:XP_005646840.1 hypothetical protein COCSUDRAFT_66551 [Coccomyxa subellipsoidea C-169]